MNIDYDELLKEINQNFPPINFIFCYGSAAFPQSGYNYSQETPMVDLIFVVDDYKEWHQQNFIRNSCHYSGLGYYFGASFLSFFERTFVPVHYNPYVKILKYKVKYGVVSLNEILSNLEKWGNLVLAGRMHKPIRILKNNSVLYSERIKQAITYNYLNALAISFLLHNEERVPEKQLYHTISSLSFIGDIRMILGFEKKDKIDGIVDKQHHHFKKIYNEALEKSEFKTLIKYNEKENSYEIDDFATTRNKLIEHIPYEIGIRYTGMHKTYTEILKAKKTKEIQFHIVKTIKRMNLSYSIRLIFYHFLTTSFKKNVLYSWTKIMKRFK